MYNIVLKMHNIYSNKEVIIVQIFVENIRKEKNMSVEQLSAVSGVPESMINKLESGNQNPTIDMMCKLAKALDVPGAELFSYYT